MSTDLLVGGSGAVRRRPVLRLLVVALAVLAVAGYAGVRLDRGRQVDALIAGAAQAEQVVSDAERSLAGLVRYSQGTLSAPDLGAEQRDAVLQSFVRDAERFRPRMAAPRARVAGVRVAPWDGRLREARTAVLARIDAWTAALDAARAEPDRLLTQRRDTGALRGRAAASLVTAAGGRGGTALRRLVAELVGR